MTISKETQAQIAGAPYDLGDLYPCAACNAPPTVECGWCGEPLCSVCWELHQGVVCGYCDMARCEAEARVIVWDAADKPIPLCRTCAEAYYIGLGRGWRRHPAEPPPWTRRAETHWPQAIA